MRSAAALLALAAAGAAGAQTGSQDSSAAVRQAPRAPTAADVPSSPLAEAAARGDTAAVRALLAAGAVDANAPDRDGTPALHWVVRVGDLETAKRLLAAARLLS